MAFIIRSSTMIIINIGMIIILNWYNTYFDNRENKYIDVESGLGCYSNDSLESCPNKITPDTSISTLLKTAPHVFISHSSTNMISSISISSTLLAHD